MSSHIYTSTNLPAWLVGEFFSFERIYDAKRRVMKPREIFTVSVRAYYPEEENGVNWKYLLKTGCCLKRKNSLASVQSEF